MTDSQLAPPLTLAQQVRAAAATLDKLKKPTQPDRAVFRTLVEREPNLWRVTGDLAAQAEAYLLVSVPMSESMRASLQIGMEQLRKELAGTDAPRMVALLVEHAVMCWLRLQVTEWAYTTNKHGKDGYSAAAGDYWERRLSMAQGRYLRALETLARVQKLSISVHINIATDGGQQVNVAG